MSYLDKYDHQIVFDSDFCWQNGHVPKCNSAVYLRKF